MVFIRLDVVRHVSRKEADMIEASTLGEALIHGAVTLGKRRNKLDRHGL